MKTCIHFLAALMVAVAVLPLRAQVVPDGAAATLSNVINTFTGTLAVGTNGSFTLPEQYSQAKRQPSDRSNQESRP